MKQPAQLTRTRYWGDRTPPKPENKASVFGIAISNAASPKTTGTVATLRIYGPIDSWGGWWGVSAKEVAEALDQLDDSVDTVQVRLNSPGGEAFEGVAIMNLLRAHKARTVAVVDGLAASAASIIATGCDELVMSPGSELMIHDASSYAYGDAAEMEKAQRMLDSVSNTIASVYAAKAGGSTEDWRALMRAETWYTADEAVTAGLAERTETVPDAGPTETAGGEPDTVVIPGDVEDHFDLSFFTYAGRSKAPAPAAIQRGPQPPSASAVGSTTEGEGGSAVAFSNEQITALRNKLGVAEDADEATILAALDEALDERAEDPQGTTPTAQVPEGMVLVDSAVLEDLKSGAAAGRTAAKQLADQARDQVIDAAITAGKTTPARREHWVKSYDADPEGTKALLAALEPGLAVPLNELGHAIAPVENSEDDALYASVFGDEKKEA